MNTTKKILNNELSQEQFEECMKKFKETEESIKNNTDVKIYMKKKFQNECELYKKYTIVSEKELMHCELELEIAELKKEIDERREQLTEMSKHIDLLDKNGRKTKKDILFDIIEHDYPEIYSKHNIGDKRKSDQKNENKKYRTNSEESETKKSDYGFKSVEHQRKQYAGKSCETYGDNFYDYLNE